MTQDELEARIAALGGQIAALELSQEAQRKHWAQCAMYARFAVVPLALLTLTGAILGVIAHRADPITQVFGATMTLTLFLALAFQRAAGPAARA